MFRLLLNTRNSSGDEIAKRDFSVYLFILQMYNSLKIFVQQPLNNGDARRSRVNCP